MQYSSFSIFIAILFLQFSSCFRSSSPSSLFASSLVLLWPSFLLFYCPALYLLNIPLLSLLFFMLSSLDSILFCSLSSRCHSGRYDTKSNERKALHIYWNSCWQQEIDWGLDVTYIGCRGRKSSKWKYQWWVVEASYLHILKDKRLLIL